MPRPYQRCSPAEHNSATDSSRVISHIVTVTRHTVTLCCVGCAAAACLEHDAAAGAEHGAAVDGAAGRSVTRHQARVIIVKQTFAAVRCHLLFLKMLLVTVTEEASAA